VKQQFCKIIQLCNKAKLMNELPATCKGKNAISNDKVNGALTKKGRKFFKKFDKRAPLCLKIKDMTDTRDKLEAECWNLDYCTGYTWPHGKKGKQTGSLMNCGKQSDKAWIIWYRRWKGKFMSGKKHSHNSRRTTKTNSRQSICSCTNDIHCKPFLGNWFDVHHVASFTFAKDAGGEVQLKTYTCNARGAPWSGGLGIACVQSCHQQGSPKTFSARRLAKGSCSLAFKGGNLLGKSLPQGGIAGLCGGSALYKRAGNMNKGWRARSAGQAARREDSSYSCQDCFTGMGAWGSQCACHEFMNPQGKDGPNCKSKGEGCKQFGASKPYPSKNSMGKWKVKPSIDLAKIRRDTEKCARTFFLTPVGRLVLRHEGLWRIVSQFAKGCAVDGEAKFKPKKVGVKSKVAANVCRAARAMATKSDGSDNLLCRIVKLCGLKSDRCKTKTKEQAWREWAKKNKKKLDYYSKFPKYEYKKKYKKSWPRCANIRCITAAKKVFESTCDKYSGCTGYTFKEKSKGTGSGCLKRCGRREFGGKGKGKHDYWRKVTGKKDLPPRKTPRQKAIKKLVKKVAKKVAKDPKVANAKNPKKEAKKLVKKILPKVLQKAAVPKKDVKKLIKKAKQVVKKKTAPAGKRGLVANQEQTQNKGGRKRKRKRQGAGKWAKHGCKVTQDWANAHINWCPWASWTDWSKKAKLRGINAQAEQLKDADKHDDKDGSKGTAQAEELHVKSAEARTIKEAKDDLEDEESEEDF